MLQFTAKWFFVLLVNFLVLVWILNIILFKPMLKVFGQRKSTIDEAMEKSRQMQARKEEAMAIMKRDLEHARSQAKQAFDALRGEGLAVQKESLTKANEDAMKLSEKIKEELRVETEKARGALRAEVEKFSDSILEKLVRT
ncbi:MAG: ATP synthase F0 subunit B [Nitrospiraceae bacterium]|nr:ATP synthase F0 subunit B [Nitrospiraceae bacterium]